LRVVVAIDIKKGYKKGALNKRGEPSNKEVRVVI
jgi:hypothetical protein